MQKKILSILFSDYYPFNRAWKFVVNGTSAYIIFRAEGLAGIEFHYATQLTVLSD